MGTADDLRRRAYVVEALGLGCPDERPRQKAAGLMRKAAAILDCINATPPEQETPDA